MRAIEVTECDRRLLWGHLPCSCPPQMNSVWAQTVPPLRGQHADKSARVCRSPMQTRRGALGTHATRRPAPAAPAPFAFTCWAAAGTCRCPPSRRARAEHRRPCRAAPGQTVAKGGGYWRLSAGARAPPQPLSGTHAARARLPSQEGRPVQAGGPLERWAGRMGCREPDHCAHALTGWMHVWLQAAARAAAPCLPRRS